jgi:hypothetical protein
LIAPFGGLFGGIMQIIWDKEKNKPSHKVDLKTGKKFKMNGDPLTEKKEVSKRGRAKKEEA